MAENQTVWIVTSGEYSDYRYHGIFSTKEKAEAYIKKNALVPYGDKAQCKPVILDNEDDVEMRTQYHCVLNPDGSVHVASASPASLVSARTRGSAEWNGRGFVAVSYESPEHAMKLAVEARQAHLRQLTENGTERV